MKILVAEDNVVTATLMVGILTRHGYSVVLARNGSEALSLLGSHPDIQGVITDIMMPEFSGLDLLRALHKHEVWKKLPTIVATLRDDHETVAEAVALGCKEYFLKPVRPARLMEKVAKVFTPEKVVLMSSAEVISRYSLNVETYRKMARNFARQVDGLIADLRNWSAIGGSALHLDFIPITECATLLGAERLMEVLENTSSSAASWRLIPVQVNSLQGELQLVREALKVEIS